MQWSHGPNCHQESKVEITHNHRADPCRLELLAISHGWIPCLFQNSALISATYQAEVTILTPISSPTVFNQPIVLAILCSIPDSQHSVVKGIRTIGIDDSTPVVLNRARVLCVQSD